MYFDYVLIIRRKLIHKHHPRVLTVKKIIWVINFWATLIRKKLVFWANDRNLRVRIVSGTRHEEPFIRQFVAVL